MNIYVDNFPGRILHQNGEEYRYFGGTAYLGLQTDEAFRKLFVENIKKYGTNYSASRKSNVRFSVYEKAEAFLADLAGSEACITVSSGYLAGQLVCSHFNTPEYKTFYAPSAHPALQRKNNENYNTFDALNAAIITHIKITPSIQPVLYIDTIDPIGAQYPTFQALKKLPLEKIVLVADDSHGFGITGNRGGGSYSVLAALDAKELVVCGSLGKGFGITAGAVLGNRSFIESLTKTNIVTASSPVAPAALATFLDAEHIYREKRRKLLEHVRIVLREVRNLSGFRYRNDYPVFAYADDTLTEHLQHHGIIVTHFKYPDENGDTVSRIVLSAHHTAADILKLTGALNSHPTKPLH